MFYVTKQFTNEEMITELRKFYIAKGKRPRMSDFKGKKPSCDQISKRFGSWSKALKSAGVPYGKRKESDYDKDYLLECLLDYYKKYDKVPTIRGMKGKGYPTVHPYIVNFGSFKNALVEAKLFEHREDKHQFCEVYTDEQLIRSLKEYMRDKETIPTYEIMNKELKPSLSTFLYRFNSLENMFRQIGLSLEDNKLTKINSMKEDMIKKYQDLHNQLERVPSAQDVDEASSRGECYGSKTYSTYFGGITEVQKICGYKLSRRYAYSKQELIEDILFMEKEMGRVPSQLHVKLFNCISPLSAFINEFGTWTEALKASGLKPTKKPVLSTRGVKCFSYYELLMTNMLEVNDIQFTTEDCYRDFMRTNRYFRFDRVIEINNKKYFVEIFGITENKRYTETIKEKINLCKANNIPLIAIYPKDFTSNNLDDIHAMLLNKITELDKTNIDIA